MTRRALDAVLIVLTIALSYIVINPPSFLHFSSDKNQTPAAKTATISAQLTPESSQNSLASTQVAGQQAVKGISTSSAKLAVSTNDVCVRVPTLMYHHIQDLGQAKAQGHPGLAVSPDYFQQQMQYLHNNGYHTITMTALDNYFDSKTPLPSKPVIISFDDGYKDFATNAYPVLKQYGLHATMFLPTGLVGNPDYLTWQNIQDEKEGGLVEFANHTWSHHSMQSTATVIDSEIHTADVQLSSKGLDQSKTFAYPYGTASQGAIQFLQNEGYKLAFTTQYGTNLCKSQRYTLPRVRISNTNMAYYHL